MYGCETFAIMADAAGNIEAFEMWTLRMLLKISWKKKVTDKEVLRRARVKRETLYTIKVRKTRYCTSAILFNRMAYRDIFWKEKSTEQDQEAGQEPIG